MNKREHAVSGDRGRKDIKDCNHSRTPTAIQWARSILHLIIFWIILLSTHIPLMIARLFGARAMCQVLNLHCLFHLLNIRLTGATISYIPPRSLDKERARILVSNHQSMYDIPLIMWHLRTIDPKFIAKIELARKIPSISFALRNGGHLIIDRSKGKRSVLQLRNAGSQFEKDNGTLCLFPEGTRSPSGELKKFKAAGFHTLFDSMPNAEIVPVTLDGTGAIVKNKFLPLPLNTQVLLHIHLPVSREGRNAAEVLAECESVISATLDNFRKNSAPQTTPESCERPALMV